ncbi:MAG: hypothetical protein PF488_04715 [Patescibacteria group bacterium]|jgi:hypothetical protein|nr:hypothetical protein [Patescibacteria group bacterium]
MNKPTKKPKKSIKKPVIKDNGVVIDTTDEAFSGGICLDLGKIYK